MKFIGFYAKISIFPPLGRIGLCRAGTFKSKPHYNKCMHDRVSCTYEVYLLAFMAITPYSRIANDASSAVELEALRDKDNKNGKEPKANTNNVARSSRHPFPWQTASALISIVLLTAAAVGVLLASNNSPISRWKVRNVAIQPQVWLSVLATITDGLTMFALAKAAETTYWRAAARGTTLRSMYDLYESHSFAGALTNLVRLRGDKLAVATLLCLVSALRGPLFQRASVVVGSSTRRTEGVQSVRVAQLIPPNFLYQNGTRTSTLYDGVYDAYIERAAIRVDVDEGQCGDVCYGKVKVGSLLLF